MNIPGWIVSGFAVFGFICAWCTLAGWLGSRLMQFSKESEDEHAGF